jgi:heme exporter protein CcmD
MFEMGDYGAYIWPAYAVTAVALVGVTVWTVVAWRTAKAKLAALENRK